MDKSLIEPIILILLSVIGYFLRSLHAKVIDMEKGRIQRGLELERVKVETHQAVEEISAIKQKQARHDERTEMFYKEFSEMVTKAIKPLFDVLESELNHINKELEHLKK